MKFLKTLRCDLNKTIINLGFFGAVIITFILCFTASAYVDDMVGKSYSVFEALFTLDKSLIESDFTFASIRLFSIGLTGYVKMFLPIIVAFPFMVTFCAERNSGLMRYSITRTGKLRYYLSKFTASLIGGGLATMLGLALYGIVVFFLFPSVSDYSLTEEQIMLIVPSTQPQMIIKSLLSALVYGAFSALPAFFISSFCRNPYLITCIPFMLIYIWETAITKLLTAAWANMEYERGARLLNYYPDSITLLINATEWNDSLKTIILLHGSIFTFVLAGYIVIMNLRTDKGT